MFIVHATLISLEDEAGTTNIAHNPATALEDASDLATASKGVLVPSRLAGTTVVSLTHIRNPPPGKFFFILNDLSIRQEGFYRLKFRVFEVPLSHSYVYLRGEVDSSVITVYSPKNFPGLATSSNLIMDLASRGHKVRVRKESTLQKRRKKTSPATTSSAKSVTSRSSSASITSPTPVIASIETATSTLLNDRKLLAYGASSTLAVSTSPSPTSSYASRPESNSSSPGVGLVHSHESLPMQPSSSLAQHMQHPAISPQDHEGHSITGPQMKQQQQQQQLEVYRSETQVPIYYANPDDPRYQFATARFGQPNAPPLLHNSGERLHALTPDQQQHSENPSIHQSHMNSTHAHAHHHTTIQAQYYDPFTACIPNLQQSMAMPPLPPHMHHPVSLGQTGVLNYHLEHHQGSAVDMAGGPVYVSARGIGATGSSSASSCNVLPTSHATGGGNLGSAGAFVTPESAAYLDAYPHV